MLTLANNAGNTSKHVKQVDNLGNIKMSQGVELVFVLLPQKKPATGEMQGPKL